MNKEKIKEYIPYLIIIIVVVLIRSFLFTPISVNGTSMVPTLKGNEIMILNKISLKTSKLKRFQIVVLKENNSYLIKRVIGLPSEKIKCEEGIVYINGKKIVDNYGMGITQDFEEQKIPPDYYFVMGDNRVVSKDSRYFGSTNIEEFRGTTNLVIWPLNKMGTIK